MTHTQTTKHRSRVMTIILLGVALLAVLLVSGCSGPQSVPLTGKPLRDLGETMVEIEKTPADKLKTRTDDLDRAINKLRKRESRDTKTRTELSRDYFEQGYIAEVLATRSSTNIDERDYSDARLAYQDAISAGGPEYGTQARFRLGILGVNYAMPNRPESEKLAKDNLGIFRTAGRQKIRVWVRTPDLAGENGPATLVTGATNTEGPVLREEDPIPIALRKLDVIYRTSGGRDEVSYHIIDRFVSVFRAVSPSYGPVIALFFIAAIVVLVTIPFRTKTFRGMQDMQRIQPLLKNLQEQYKNDRQKLAEEQMRLMKEHQVNPAGGCLPMIIQIPIFIVVWQAIQVYLYNFAHTRFIWVSSLAQPDIPLLVLYAGSMVVTQWLTATPSADPQQKLVQRQMTIMMPFLMFIFLMTFPSAFVLYWLFLNILMSTHQYFLLRQLRQENAEAPAAEAPAKPEPPTSSKAQRRKNRKEQE